MNYELCWWESNRREECGKLLKLTLSQYYYSKQMLETFVSLVSLTSCILQFSLLILVIVTAQIIAFLSYCITDKSEHLCVVMVFLIMAFFGIQQLEIILFKEEFSKWAARACVTLMNRKYTFLVKWLCHSQLGQRSQGVHQS